MIDSSLSWEVRKGDCLALLRELPDNSVDALVSDPPAGINFMSAPFDSDRGGRDKWIAWLSEVMALCCREERGPRRTQRASHDKTRFLDAVARSLDLSSWRHRSRSVHGLGYDGVRLYA